MAPFKVERRFDFLDDSTAFRLYNDELLNLQLWKGSIRYHSWGIPHKYSGCNKRVIKLESRFLQHTSLSIPHSWKLKRIKIHHSHALRNLHKDVGNIWPLFAFVWYIIRQSKGVAWCESARAIECITLDKAVPILKCRVMFLQFVTYVTKEPSNIPEIFVLQLIHKWMEQWHHNTAYISNCNLDCSL